MTSSWSSSLTSIFKGSEPSRDQEVSLRTAAECSAYIQKLDGIGCERELQSSQESVQEVIAGLRVAIDVTNRNNQKTQESSGYSDDEPLSSEDLCIAALDAVSRLCEQDYADRCPVSPGNVVSGIAFDLGNMGATSMVDQLLGLNISASAACCFSALRAMSCLIGSVVPRDSRGVVKSNLKHLCSSGSIYRVLKAAMTHLTVDYNVLLYALRVTNTIAPEQGMVAKLLACGGCDLLSQSLLYAQAITPALNTGSGTLDIGGMSDLLIQWTCRTIDTFIRNDDSDENNCQDKFASQYVCESIALFLIEKQLSHLSAAYLLRVVGSLARYHAVNKKKLGDLGICECIPRLHQTYFQAESEYESDSFAFFTEAICWSIANLAYPDESNQDKLGAVDACDIVMDALGVHRDQPIVVQEGLRALRNLAFSHDANLELFYSWGERNRSEDKGVQSVCAVLMQIEERYRSNCGVLQWVWCTVAALVEHKHGLLQQFGSLGVCDALIGTLRSFPDEEDLVQWTALAIASVSVDDSALSNLLGKRGCCQALGKVLATHISNADLVEELLYAVGAVCVSSTVNRQYFASLGTHQKVRSQINDEGNELANISQEIPNICNSIVKAIHKNHKNEGVVKQGLFALKNLLHSALSASDIPLINIESIDCGKSPAPIRTSGDNTRLQLMEALAGTVGGVYTRGYSVLCNTIYKHAESEEIALLGCKLICELGYPMCPAEKGATGSTRWSQLVRFSGGGADADDSVVVKLGSAGAADALCASIHYHISSSILCLWSIVGLNQLCKFDKNVPIIRSAGAVNCALDLLKYHMQSIPIDPHSNGVSETESEPEAVPAANAVEMLFGQIFQLVAHLCVEPLGREEMIHNGGAQLMLQAIGSYASSRIVAKLGSMALSSLCVSPRCDAIATILAKDALNVYDCANSSVDSVNSINEDWQNFDSRTSKGREPLGPEASSGDAKSGGMSKMLSGMFGQSEAAGEESSLCAASCEEERGGASAMDNFGIARKGQNTEQMYGAKGFNTIKDAASSIISSEPPKSVYMIGYNVLVSSGAIELLTLLLENHGDDEAVLTFILNAINSLFLGAVSLGNKSFLEGTKEDVDRNKRLLERLFESFKKHIDYKSDVLSSSMSSSNDVFDDMYMKPNRREVLALYCIVSGNVCLSENDFVSQQQHQEHLQQHQQQQDQQQQQYMVHHLSGKISNRLNQDYMGTLDVCHMIHYTLKHVRIEPLCCETGLRAMYYLMLNHPSNQKVFGELDSCKLVVDILRKSLDLKQKRLVYYACLCIAALATNSRQNSILLGQDSVCVTVVEVLEKYAESSELTSAACQAVYGLHTLNKYLGSSACKLVLRAFRLHPDNASVAQAVCLAIGSLAENENNKIALDKHNVCKIVTSALMKHVSGDGVLSSVLSPFFFSSAGVAQWGCTAIYYLARGYNSKMFQEKLLTCGACDAVARALVKFSEVESVSHACCRSLVVLLINNDVYKVKLGSMSVCAHIVESLHLFPASEKVAKWGCRAVAVLAEYNDSNTAKLGSAGACETIPIVMQAHQRSVDVAGAGCDVISFMSENLENGFASRFGHLGACEAVVSTLQRHATNANVVSRASIALASLARVRGNSSWLGPAGASDALLHALQIHKKDIEVCKFVLSAVGNLCIIETNKERLGSIGMCEEVTEAMNVHMYDLDTVKAAVTLVAKLCEYEKSVESVASTERDHDKVGKVPMYGNNRGRLLENNVYDVLSLAFSYHLGEEQAACVFCRCIWIVSSGDLCHRERATLGSSGACQAVTKVLQRHGSVEEVAKYAALATKALAYRNKQNKRIFRETGACAYIMDVLRNFRYSSYNHHSGMPGACEAAAGAIANLTMDCRLNCAAFGESGGCEGLLEIMELHGRNIRIAELSMKALFYLTNGNSANRLKVSFSGAADIMMILYNKYPNETGIVEMVLSTMIGMCLDKVGQSRLGTVGACKAVVAAFYRFEKSSERITLLSIVLISELAKHSPSNQEKLGQAGATKVVVSAMSRYKGAVSGGVSRTVTAVSGNSIMGTLFNKVTSNTSEGSLGSLARKSGTNTPSKGSAISPSTSSGALHQLEDSFENELTSEGTVDVTSISIEKPRNAAEVPSRTASPSKTALSVVSLVEDDRRRERDEYDYDGTEDEEEVPSTLAYLLTGECGQESLLKESCKAIVYLSAACENNQQRFLMSGVLDLITAILSSSALALHEHYPLDLHTNTSTASNQQHFNSPQLVPSTSVSPNTTGTMPLSSPTFSISTRELEKKWAEKAMDILIGKTYA